MMRDRIPVGLGSPVEVPEPFAGLYDLAHNVWWSWDPPARSLWQAIDAKYWSENRNPLSLLAATDRFRWNELGTDAEFTELYHDVLARFDSYLADTETWYRAQHHGALDAGIAYLSAEFGVHESLPFYSGGLGVLSGDHAKAASDLGLPLVGVGLFYRRGYFAQEVDHDGEQQHQYRHIELARRPVRPILGGSGEQLHVSVDLPGRAVLAAAWRIDVGRVPLVLLDTDVGANHPADRPITHILYVRDREARLAQEIVLGIGAVKVLEALGIDPAVWHVNEGHAAFSLLERMRRSDPARVAANSVFTLHTPVPAGNEVFDPAIVEPYLASALPGLPWQQVHDLGRAPNDGGFNMSALAIRLTSLTNGVSKRHAEVATGDWHDVIGGPAVPITNAVHLPTWTGRQMTEIWESALGPSWHTVIVEPERAQAIRGVDAAALWEARTTQKEIMIAELRLRLLEQGARQGSASPHLRHLYSSLPPERLTMVFARRFATYKRARLLFWDYERLASILTSADRPVQVVFAGKAHPADRAGQDLIKSVMAIATKGELRDYVFYIENYDMGLARYLVSGADVWLNNPQPPKEASGTSGMKAAANGALNLSVLDGWWLEGYNGHNGWGWGAEGGTEEADAAVLYDLLEHDVAPAYYDVDDDGLPRRWLDMMIESLATAVGPFAASRMLIDYTEKAYLPFARS